MNGSSGFWSMHYYCSHNIKPKWFLFIFRLVNIKVNISHMTDRFAFNKNNPGPKLFWNRSAAPLDSEAMYLGSPVHFVKSSDNLITSCHQTDIEKWCVCFSIKVLLLPGAFLFLQKKLFKNLWGASIGLDGV